MVIDAFNAENVATINQYWTDYRKNILKRLICALSLKIVMKVNLSWKISAQF
ncbi:Uncharacterised protein [Weissella viridescens]|uniref:Uncharacterized protein n=1 Tax=Weissella viridescens TaxID=1629 RepID=A0A380P3C9_WEIVI|nr:Uncharacterised protein [Weissella viridescens]